MSILSALPEDGIDALITEFVKIIGILQRMFYYLFSTRWHYFRSKILGPVLSSESLNKRRLKKYSYVLRREPFFSEGNLQKASKISLI